MMNPCDHEIQEKPCLHPSGTVSYSWNSWNGRRLIIVCDVCGHTPHVDTRADNEQWVLNAIEDYDKSLVLSEFPFVDNDDVGVL